MPTLPDWRVLEFEEQAFWATAHSRLELPDSAGGQSHWKFVASSSIPGNTEQETLRFEPASGALLARERLSYGKKDQRLKTYEYGADHILRERRAPPDDADTPPAQWPTTSSKEISYPDGAAATVTNSYLLLLLAQRLQANCEGASTEVTVHTDFNFYRARLTCGNGVPVEADYVDSDGKRTTGSRSTRAVAVRASPEGDLVEKDDFTLLGLHGEIIILFDAQTGLPLQVRGQAPRVGDMQINLKSVTMRKPTS